MACLKLIYISNNLLKSWLLITRISTLSVLFATSILLVMFLELKNFLYPESKVLDVNVHLFWLDHNCNFCRCNCLQTTLVNNLILGQKLLPVNRLQVWNYLISENLIKLTILQKSKNQCRINVVFISDAKYQNYF